MLALRALNSGLGWIGGQGTRAVAASLFLGIGVPPLAAVMKPFLVPSIFFLLVLAFLRVDVTRVAQHVRRPVRVVMALAWMLVAVPLIVGGLIWLTDLGRWAPGLDTMLILLAVAPPIMSAPAFAYLLRLDGALALTLLVLAMLVVPVTGPFVADLVLPEALPLPAMDLAVRLVVMLSGALIVAGLIRRAVGLARLAVSTRQIDGMNVILLFIFAVALMDGVAAKLFFDPLVVIALIVLAFALALGTIGLTMVLFRAVGPAEALTVALSAGSRNMGMMVAATGAQLPELGWLFFALGQFPIYLLPQMMQPIAARVLARNTPAPS